METQKRFVGFEKHQEFCNKKMGSFLIDNSYKRLNCELCIFVKTQTNEKGEGALVNLVPYVDIIFACKNLSVLKNEKSVPMGRFEMTDGGAAQFILGVEIKRL